MTANKITLFFLGLAGSFMVFALLLFSQGNNLKNLSEDISVHWIPNLIAINAIHTATSDYRSTVAQHVISEQDTEMEEHEEILTRLSTEITGWQNWYKQNISQNQERVLYDTYLGSYQDYDTATRQVLALSQTNEARAFVQFRRNRGLLPSRWKIAVFRTLSRFDAGFLSLGSRASRPSRGQGWPRYIGFWAGREKNVSKR